MATKEKRLSDIDIAKGLSARIEFLTADNSPFSDGYSIEEEEKFLQSAEIAEDDPLYDRVIELEDRKERLEQMRAEHAARKGADVLVKPSEAAALGELGRLVDEGVDKMELHTIEAVRMFMGRRRAPGSEAAPIIGGRRVAAALRNLWLLTANDNPYADWALVRHEHSMEDLRKLVVEETRRGEELLGASRSRGISFAIVRSEKPASVNLGFGSPYGYEVAPLIADFDLFVRVMKTLERKSLKTDEEVRALIARVTRLIRGTWNSTERFSTWLTRQEIVALSRRDFAVRDADEAAAKRVEFVTQVFGVVQASIFTTELAPSHSRRRFSISPEERRLLLEIGARLAAGEQEAASVADGDDAGAGRDGQESAAMA
ncbi:TIGR03761 family integrating conjugative element protein [Corticibacter populi]|uniref:TIGR03761 family integrating conjugative element protein n=1 Tax=Corticibacter populi TaxID=1550736 RepID=A0A3M6QYZ2_9BURK|nr:TIGR03761 family integrating conjugative element protein [Corticibacter populi]RMX08227.1 TIGR03761 family integrating conjugative element protein [Corticibacter populi]RZS35500.1 integrating conjugative element protein (TIGR03761 family) [Corticibacter populi]